MKPRVLKRTLASDPAEVLEAARHADWVDVLDEHGRVYMRVSMQNEPLTFESNEEGTAMKCAHKSAAIVASEAVLTDMRYAMARGRIRWCPQCGAIRAEQGATRKTSKWREVGVKALIKECEAARRTEAARKANEQEQNHEPTTHVRASRELRAPAPGARAQLAHVPP